AAIACAFLSTDVSSSKAERKASAGHDVVLPAASECIEAGASRVKITNLRAQADEAPRSYIEAAAEVEHAAMRESCGRVGLAADLLEAFLVERVASAGRHVRRELGARHELEPQARRHVERGDVAGRGPVDRRDVSQRVGEEV